MEVILMDRYARLMARICQETDAILDKGDDTMDMEGLKSMSESKILYARIKKEFLLANCFGTIMLFDLSKLTDAQLESVVNAKHGQELDDMLDEMAYVTAVAS